MDIAKKQSLIRHQLEDWTKTEDNIGVLKSVFLNKKS